MRTWHCNHCASKNVFHRAFINPNTGENFKAGSDEGYCSDCEETTGNGDCKIYSRDD